MDDKRFYVVAMDENTTRDDVVLGKGELSIRSLIKNMNVNTKLNINLSNDIGGICGRVEVTCALRKAAMSEVVTAIPDSEITLENGVLAIHQIELKNLKGAENFLGKKDPYIKLSIENVSTFQTKHQDNAGSNAIWKDIKDMK